LLIAGRGVLLQSLPPRSFAGEFLSSEAEAMKAKTYSAILGLILGIGWAQTGSAAVLFSDDFNSEPQSLGTTPLSPAFANWTVTTGSVDVIGSIPTPNFDFYPGNGNYVDLDGSNNQLGTLASKATFGAGTYTLSFDLSGYTYNGQYPLESTLISIGNWSQLITPSVDSSITSGAPMQFWSFTF
jgi:hypothetical protein